MKTSLSAIDGQRATLLTYDPRTIWSKTSHKWLDVDDVVVGHIYANAVPLRIYFEIPVPTHDHTGALVVKIQITQFFFFSPENCTHSDRRSPKPTKPIAIAAVVSPSLFFVTVVFVADAIVVTAASSSEPNGGNACTIWRKSRRLDRAAAETAFGRFRRSLGIIYLAS